MDRLIYTVPLQMAAKFNTRFLCYGENVSFEYGGNADVETYSAKDQIENGVAVGFPKEELLGYGGSENDLILTEAPSAEEMCIRDSFTTPPPLRSAAQSACPPPRPLRGTAWRLSLIHI